MNKAEEIQARNRDFESFKAHYDKLANKSRQENRKIMNHVCIRVDDLDASEQLLVDSFGISNFLRLDGQKFKGEKRLSVAWVGEEMYLELMEPLEKQSIGYDTGCSHPIGHLSEVGFFVPNMDEELERLNALDWEVKDSLEDLGCRMIKIDTKKPSGFPVELIEIDKNEPGSSNR